jgi:hypothetical protein
VKVKVKNIKKESILLLLLLLLKYKDAGTNAIAASED